MDRTKDKLKTINNPQELENRNIKRRKKKKEKKNVPKRKKRNIK